MPVRPIVVGRDDEDVDEFGREGTIFLGKHIVGEGQNAHLTNPVSMDVARPHVMLILGKRGQGKSYSMAVIAEEISQMEEEVKNNLSVIMIDTMGIFWSMKNANERQLDLLSEWGLEPKGFEVDVHVPRGFREHFSEKDIPYDDIYALDPADLTSEDWALSLNLSLVEPIGILLDRTIRKLEESGEDYTIERMIEIVQEDERAKDETKHALENRLLSAQDWGIFSKDAAPIEDILEAGKVSIIDTSLFSQIGGSGWSVRTLLVGLLSRRIYQRRVGARRVEESEKIAGTMTGKEVPMTWLMIDEAHQFLPAEGKTAASEGLLTLVKQGRQPGISCVFATQRPNKLHEDAISQSDLILSHRLTSKADIEALRGIMQTYLLFDITKYIDELPREKGTALVLDDNSERLYKLQVRPRQSWHAGETPSAIETEEETLID